MHFEGKNVILFLLEQGALGAPGGIGLCIQNGEPKFAKCAHFCQVSQFCFKFEKKKL